MITNLLQLTDEDFIKEVDKVKVIYINGAKKHSLNPFSKGNTKIFSGASFLPFKNSIIERLYNKNLCIIKIKTYGKNRYRHA